MSNISDPQNAARLAKVLQLLDSPHDGEALSAARRTMAILRQFGMTADEMAKRLTTATPGPSRTSDRATMLETQLAAANTALKAVKAELKHWQDQAWAAASLVAELEDAVRMAKSGPKVAKPAQEDGSGDSNPAEGDAQTGAASEQALPRTQEEKRLAVLRLLRDPDTSSLPDRELARRLALSPQTIGNWRRRLGLVKSHVYSRRGSIKSN